MLQFRRAAGLQLGLDAPLLLQGALELIVLVSKRHHGAVHGMRYLRRGITVTILHQCLIRYVTLGTVAVGTGQLDVGEGSEAAYARLAALMCGLGLVLLYLLAATLQSFTAQHRRRYVTTLLL